MVVVDTAQLTARHVYDDEASLAVISIYTAMY
jgi:hypothetical protein